jgi:hypothetical protein
VIGKAELFPSGSLRGLGTDMIGPAGEVDDAIGVVKSGEIIEAAVLDVNLKNVSILPVAGRLRAQHTFRFPRRVTTGA